MFPVRGKGGVMEKSAWIPLIILGADSICDLRRLEIFPLLTLAGIAAGIPLRLLGGLVTAPELIFALLPGAVVLTGSVLTRGQIGRGDALAIFMIGAWADLWLVWEVVLFGTFAAAAFCVLLWSFRRKNEEIPFVPFLFAAFLACSLI